jgi:hypothetical protein
MRHFRLQATHCVPLVPRKKFRQRQEMYERTFPASSSDSKWLKSIMDYCIQDQNATSNDLEVIKSPTTSTSSSESDDLQYGWPWIDPPRLRTGFRLSYWFKNHEIRSKIPVIWPLGHYRHSGSKKSRIQGGANHKNLIQLIGNPAFKGQPTLKNYHKGLQQQTKLPSVRQLRTLDFSALK